MAYYSTPYHWRISASVFRVPPPPCIGSPPTILRTGRRSVSDSPPVAPRRGYRSGPAAGRRFVFGIWSRSKARKCRPLPDHCNIRRGSDTHNQMYFSRAERYRAVIVRVFLRWQGNKAIDYGNLAHDSGRSQTVGPSRVVEKYLKQDTPVGRPPSFFSVCVRPQLICIPHLFDQ